MERNICIYDAKERKHPHTRALRKILRDPATSKETKTLCREALAAVIPVYRGHPKTLPRDPEGKNAEDAEWVDWVLDKVSDLFDPSVKLTGPLLMQTLLTMAHHWCDRNDAPFYEQVWWAQVFYEDSSAYFIEEDEDESQDQTPT